MLFSNIFGLSTLVTCMRFGDDNIITASDCGFFKVKYYLSLSERPNIDKTN